MDLVNKNISIKNSSKLALDRYSYHIFFWLAFYLFFVLNDNNEYGYAFTLTKEFINVTFFAVVVYVNLLFLIPNYLNGKKYLNYLGLLILFTLLITPIKTFCIYLFYTRNPDIQTFYIDKQGAIFISSLFIGLGSTCFKIINDWAIHQREKQELQKRSLESELNFLKTQINPHFLFNTLNNLYALTLKKSDKAPEIVLKLSEMMRYMLYDCNERRVSLDKEINYLRNYLDLELIRQGSNVSIGFELEGELRDQKVAPLMFIPFLENSFKHGLKNEIGKGFVHTKMKIDKDEVSMQIRNSKSSILPSQPGSLKSGGIGLVNVKKRLDLHYADRYNLEINDEPNEFIVELLIQLD